MRCGLLVLCALLVAGGIQDCAAFQAPSADTPQASQTSRPQPKRPTLWVIPHTHWEGAVFNTREEYLEQDLPNILQALRLLRAFPDFRFVLDQAAYVSPFSNDIRRRPRSFVTLFPRPAGDRRRERM